MISTAVLSQSNITETEKEKILFKIGVSDNPPIAFINDKNELDGFIVELFNTIALKENFEIEWVTDEWKNLLDRTQNGELDMITSIGYSEERNVYLEFSKESFVNSWSNIYIPKFTTIDGFLDLNKRKIGVLEGDINGEIFILRCQQFELDCQAIEKSPTYSNLFKKVANNELDAVVTNNIAGNWFAKKYDVFNSNIIFNPGLTYVAIPKGKSSTLLELYDQYLSQWKSSPNSVYYEAKTKWLSPQSKPALTKEIYYSIIGLILFAILSLLTALAFRYQIRKRVNELSIRNEQFSQIINLVPHIIYVAEDNGNILLANKNASEYFGLTKDEIERCKIDELKNTVSEGTSFLNDNNLSQNINSSQPQEVEVVDYLDNEYSLLISKMPFKMSNENHMANVTVAVDITQVKKYQQQIVQLAHFDSLTKLPNKSLFKEQILESIQEHKANKNFGAVMYLDLDSFKNINDSQGHLIGDLLIKTVAKRIQSLLDDNKSLSHFGGDEFTINFPNISHDLILTKRAVHKFCEMVLEEIAKPYKFQNRTFQITTCIGVVIYPEDGNSVELLMQRAEAALNKAKQKGRNCLQIFDNQLELSVISNHKLETDLRLAVENSDFNIVFQPLIKGARGQIVGAEALLRWEHSTLGHINPGKFIEIAERIHLIVKIGYWVIEKVCKLIKQNIDDGHGEFFIAVNVSVMQLKDNNFHKRIAELMREYKIPSNYLEIEITESVLMEDVELAIKIFNQLKSLGIKISIDDFGTGYSSFGYLFRLPIDKIKIDQSFVRNLPLDKNSVTIVRTIIKMAKELEINVLAEGVENMQQLEFLDAEGCKYFQGYLFHKPMNYDQLLQK
ncbi:MAG: EAL domain-containing protein, partial [Marinicellaceae bacterium]